MRTNARDLFWTVAWLLVAVLATRIVAKGATPSATALAATPSIAYATSPGNSVILTALVSSGATGTVTFLQNAVPLVCAGGNPATLVNGQGACITSFIGEGIHTAAAQYNGDATFAASTGTANVFVQNHAANTGTVYCNT